MTTFAHPIITYHLDSCSSLATVFLFSSTILSFSPFLSFSSTEIIYNLSSDKERQTTTPLALKVDFTPPSLG